MFKKQTIPSLGCISFVFGTMVELAIVCFLTRTTVGPKRGGGGGGGGDLNAPLLLPATAASLSSSRSSFMLPPYASTINDANYMRDSISATCNGGGGGGNGGGSLRYRSHPLANGVCGGGRGALAWTEAMHAANAAGGGINGAGNGGGGGAAHRTSSSSPPPSGRLLAGAGTPPTGSTPNAAAAAANYDMFQQTPLTFEQVRARARAREASSYASQTACLQINGYQPAPIFMRALSRRRRLFAIEPESIDKVSIVCFPLAFT